jgi:hypothetical protein
MENMPQTPHVKKYIDLNHLLLTCYDGEFCRAVWYISEDLWPFFALRIPSGAQNAVQEFLREQHLENADEVTMLKKFGRRSVANPFELQSA